MNRFSQVRYNKSQRIGILILIILLFFAELTIWLIDMRENPHESLPIPYKITAIQSQIDARDSNGNRNKSEFKSEKLQNFDPNQLDKNDWIDFGFSPKQAAVILKYKNSLGGSFSSKQEISRCFVISEEKYEELEPYILLPEYSIENSQSNHFQSNPKINYKKFNPNEYSQAHWMQIGFSEKQALTILKYKKSLGGNFKSLAEIERCFVISEDKFREMKPYMALPKAAENKTINEEIETEYKQEVTKRTQLKKFNPNEISREDWLELGLPRSKSIPSLIIKNRLEEDSKTQQH